MHFDALIELVEDDGAVAASDHGLRVLISSNAAHLWMNGANVAHLGSPERANLLYVQVFMAFSKLVRLLARTVLDVESRLDEDLEVEVWSEILGIGQDAFNMCQV